MMLFIRLLVIFLATVNVYTLDTDLSLNILGTAKLHSDTGATTSIYILPKADFVQELTDGMQLELDSKLNLYTHIRNDSTADLDLYRLKLSLMMAQAEWRLGLQEIILGPSRMLKTLDWFGAPGFLNPLKQTPGVWSLLHRYYFMNDINVWFWGVYDFDDKEKNPENTPEFGGRIQVPFLGGETAISFNAIKTSSNAHNKKTSLALDGQWDIGVGLWFEASISGFFHNNSTHEHDLIKSITIGSDYTFSFGNGLYTIVEHKILDEVIDFYNNKVDQFSYQATVFHLSYPITLMDNISAIGYVDWKYESYTQSLGWERIYDLLVLGVNFRYTKYNTYELEVTLAY